MFRTALLTTLIATTSLITPAAAEELTREEVKKLALEAILENPQIVMDAVAILRQQEEEAAEQAAKATLSDQKQILENDPNAPVLGNVNGDVTVVEFFDYNCPYCKRAKAEVDAMMAEDSNVRLVFREWPILGDGSVAATRAALASRKQGKYEEFHEALMNAKGRLQEDSVMAIAAEIGLDVDQLKADMNAPEVQEHIDTSMRLATALGFSGTPSFVIGEQLAPGLVNKDQLIELVKTVRDTK